MVSLRRKKPCLILEGAKHFNVGTYLSLLKNSLFFVDIRGETDKEIAKKLFLEQKSFKFNSETEFCIQSWWNKKWKIQNKRIPKI